MWILAVAALVYYMFGGGIIENFASIMPHAYRTQQDYETEMRNLAEGLVGPFIGDLYLHLRAKGFDNMNAIGLPAEYIPTSTSDVLLNDPILIPARRQIKNWIDVIKARMATQYDAKFLNSMALVHNLFYKEQDERLIVTYIVGGLSGTYIV